MDVTNYENRTLAAFPTDADVESWPAAFEDWLGDHAPFRNQFMALNGQLNWAVGTLDSGDVLLGKDHWLFLKDSADSTSLSDYQGLTAYPAEELETFTPNADAAAGPSGGPRHPPCHCDRPGQGGRLQSVHAGHRPGGVPPPRGYRRWPTLCSRPACRWLGRSRR